MSTAVNSMMLKAVKQQYHRPSLIKPASFTTVKLNSELVQAKKEVNHDKPILFLHGLFGSSSTFKIYA